jgi:hypothetical protein
VKGVRKPHGSKDALEGTEGDDGETDGAKKKKKKKIQKKRDRTGTTDPLISASGDSLVSPPLFFEDGSDELPPLPTYGEVERASLEGDNDPVAEKKDENPIPSQKVKVEAERSKPPADMQSSALVATTEELCSKSPLFPLTLSPVRVSEDRSEEFFASEEAMKRFKPKSPERNLMGGALGDEVTESEGEREASVKEKVDLTQATKLRIVSNGETCKFFLDEARIGVDLPTRNPFTEYREAGSQKQIRRMFGTLSESFAPHAGESDTLMRWLKFYSYIVCSNLFGSMVVEAPNLHRIEIRHKGANEIEWEFLMTPDQVPLCCRVPLFHTGPSGLQKKVTMWEKVHVVLLSVRSLRWDASDLSRKTAVCPLLNNNQQYPDSSLSVLHPASLVQLEELKERKNCVVFVDAHCVWVTVAKARKNVEKGKWMWSRETEDFAEEQNSSVKQPFLLLHGEKTLQLVDYRSFNESLPDNCIVVLLSCDAGANIGGQESFAEGLMRVSAVLAMKYPVHINSIERLVTGLMEPFLSGTAPFLECVMLLRKSLFDAQGSNNFLPDWASLIVWAGCDIQVAGGMKQRPRDSCTRFSLDGRYLEVAYLEDLLENNRVAAAFGLRGCGMTHFLNICAKLWEGTKRFEKVEYVDCCDPLPDLEGEGNSLLILDHTRAVREKEDQEKILRVIRAKQRPVILGLCGRLDWLGDDDNPLAVPIRGLAKEDSLKLVASLSEREDQEAFVERCMHLPGVITSTLSAGLPEDRVSIRGEDGLQAKLSSLELQFLCRYRKIIPDSSLSDDAEKITVRKLYVLGVVQKEFDGEAWVIHPWLEQQYQDEADLSSLIEWLCGQMENENGLEIKSRWYWDLQIENIIRAVKYYFQHPADFAEADVDIWAVLLFGVGILHYRRNFDAIKVWIDDLKPLVRTEDDRKELWFLQSAYEANLATSEGVHFYDAQLDQLVLSDNDRAYQLLVLAEMAAEVMAPAARRLWAKAQAFVGALKTPSDNVMGLGVVVALQFNDFEQAEDWVKYVGEGRGGMFARACLELNREEFKRAFGYLRVLIEMDDFPDFDSKIEVYLKLILCLINLDHKEDAMAVAEKGLSEFEIHYDGKDLGTVKDLLLSRLYAIYGACYLRIQPPNIKAGMQCSSRALEALPEPYYASVLGILQQMNFSLLRFSSNPDQPLQQEVPEHLVKLLDEPNVSPFVKSLLLMQCGFVGGDLNLFRQGRELAAKYGMKELLEVFEMMWYLMETLGVSRQSLKIAKIFGITSDVDQGVQASLMQEQLNGNELENVPSNSLLFSHQQLKIAAEFMRLLVEKLQCFQRQLQRAILKEMNITIIPENSCSLNEIRGGFQEDYVRILESCGHHNVSVFREMTQIEWQEYWQGYWQGDDMIEFLLEKLFPGFPKEMLKMTLQLLTGMQDFQDTLEADIETQDGEVEEEEEMVDAEDEELEKMLDALEDEEDEELEKMLDDISSDADTDDAQEGSK